MLELIMCIWYVYLSDLTAVAEESEILVCDYLANEVGCFANKKSQLAHRNVQCESTI